jgi:hypothetical protein
MPVVPDAWDSPSSPVTGRKEPTFLSEVSKKEPINGGLRPWFGLV